MASTDLGLNHFVRNSAFTRTKLHRPGTLQDASCKFPWRVETACRLGLRRHVAAFPRRDVSRRAQKRGHVRALQIEPPAISPGIAHPPYLPFAIRLKNGQKRIGITTCLFSNCYAGMFCQKKVLSNPPDFPIFSVNCTAWCRGRQDLLLGA